MTASKINKGFILKARKIEDSDIAHASPCTRELFDLALRKANFKDKGCENTTIRRGQWLTSYAAIQDALHWAVGCRRATYTRGQIEAATKWLRSRSMITTTKTTDGLLITICNYDVYQDAGRYERHTEDLDEHHDDATPYIGSKNEKKEKSLTAIRRVFPNASSECQVSERARTLLANPRWKSVTDPKCRGCFKSGVPAKVSADDNETLYYICEVCRG